MGTNVSTKKIIARIKKNCDAFRKLNEKEVAL
jgi:hypothetical protein